MRISDWSSDVCSSDLRKSQAARFKTLIDTLYENGVKLLASADRDPDTLYCASEDAFEFERTVSRLNEMGSHDYLARGHGVSDERSAARLADQSRPTPIPEPAHPATDQHGRTSCRERGEKEEK